MMTLLKNRGLGFCSCANPPVSDKSYPNAIENIIKEGIIGIMVFWFYGFMVL